MNFWFFLENFDFEYIFPSYFWSTLVIDVTALILYFDYLFSFFDKIIEKKKEFLWIQTSVVLENRDRDELRENSTISMISHKKN